MTDKTSFNRRRFLESSAGVATVATLGTGGALFSPQAFGQATLACKPEKDAKLRVLRWSRFVQGDIDQYMANVKTFTEKTGIEVRVDNEGWEDVRPEGGGRGQHRRRPGHHPVDQRRRQPLSGQAARRDRRVRVPRQEVRRLVPGLPGLPQARRQEVDRRAARRRRRDDRLPREHGEGGRLRHLPEGHRRLPQADEGPAGQGHAGRHGARQRDRRRPVVQLADLGVRRQARRPEQQGRDRQPGDAEGARVRQGALRHLHPGHAVVARPEQQQGLPRRPDLAHQQRHLDLLRDQELDRPEGQGDGSRHPARVLPDRAGRRADRVAPVLQPDDHEVHQVPEGGEGVPALHDGEGAVRSVAHRLRRVHRDAARRLRAACRSGPSDPKNTPYRDPVKNLRPAGYAGKLGYASAGAAADFIVVNMVAEAISGSKTPKEAMERAQKRAERYYRV